jgi:pimeloyl-CoA dehydrogenase large subunit
MELHYTPQDEAFRQHIREELRAMLPEATRKKLMSGRPADHDEMLAWQRALHDKGWGVPDWPEEFGGKNWGAIRNYIFFEELMKLPSPPRVAFGVNMIGPVIYTFGSDAQKRRFLPRIANLDDWWCQGFSEPGAGSDLASLTTRAVRAGEFWLVSGQKTWTTYAQYANWIFVLARTDPEAKKQAGISFFLVDMKTPGITVRPIQTIDGAHEINEVYFDAVSVPAENLVGEVNKGWDYAKFLLSNERTGVARIGLSKMRIDQIRQMAAVEQRNGRPLIEDRVFLRRLAAVEIELKALELTQLRAISRSTAIPKGQPDPTSSMLKIKGSELQQATTELMLEVTGAHATPFIADEVDAPTFVWDWLTPVAPLYFNTRKVTIYGGSTEIQKNIISKTVLGL